ncbi:unnamed protein product [Schistosoma mattheei]|uniref:Uncharacterized protein n=1 Tax=Schistosoma mattheei TaxID=31246 RepID=A0A3P8HLV0_9TREM|nr:unnamed protein product [Schistosoma mattheei]
MTCLIENTIHVKTSKLNPSSNVHFHLGIKLIRPLHQ